MLSRWPGPSLQVRPGVSEVGLISCLSFSLTWGMYGWEKGNDSCGRIGGCFFRALQAQLVIRRPEKTVAHPVCTKQAIGLHAGPLYCAQLQGQAHILAIEGHPLHSSPLSSVPHCQLGGFVSPAEMFLAFDSTLPGLCSDRLRVSHGCFHWALLLQDLFSRGSARVVALRPSVSPALKGFWTQWGFGHGKLFTFFQSYLSSVKENFHARERLIVLCFIRVRRDSLGRVCFLFRKIFVS